jgi:hypothetical protein
VGSELGSIDWDTLSRYSPWRDSLAERIMALSGSYYVPEYRAFGEGGSFYLHGVQDAPWAVSGYDWMLQTRMNDSRVRVLGGDTMTVMPDSADGMARIRVASDTLEFDLLSLARSYADSVTMGAGVNLTLRVEARTGARRGVLSLDGLHGERRPAWRITHWSGWLLLGR